MTWEPQIEPETGLRGWMERRPGPVAGLIARLQPAEGWAAVPLVVLLCMISAWSIADARWVLGNDKLTSFLVWIAFFGSLWGWISARLISRRWLAHLLGAVVAAFVIPVFVGYAIAPSSGSPREAYEATATAVMKAYLDLVWYRFLTTEQVGHFALFLSILVWASSQAAAFDVFGHRRPVNAVLLLAVILVGNMSLTIHDQFPALVIFSVVALALLLQTHAADERTAWLRHRIWRPHDTPIPHLRGGMAFAGIAVAASLVFTTIASSAPLADAWPGIADNFRELGDVLVRFLPASGDSRFPTTSDFPTTTVILSQWKPQDDLVFSARTEDARSVYHWRMISYDYFSKTGWQMSSGGTRTSVAAGGSIEAGTQDEPTTAGRVQRRVTITLNDKSVRQLIVANEPVSVSVDVDSNRIGSGLNGHAAYATTNSSSYVVTALVPSFDPSASGITENKLRIAGTDYPPGLKQTYTQGVEYVGGQAQTLLRQITATAPADHPYDNPYDIAKAIQDYLRSDTGPFRYNTDISQQVQDQCGGLSTVDCFAKIKQGFCQQYATEMTMLLRFVGIPARYVQGYLPGAIDPRSLNQNVYRRQQHAWVEVYFPGYGWIEFDPTGSVGQPNTIPAGPAVSATPKPSTTPTPSDAPDRTIRPRPSGPIGGGTTGSGGDNLPMILLVALVALAFVGLLSAIWYRRSRMLESPDAVYRRVARMAGWLGYRPQPTQTVYEYMGTLEAILPQARPHLETVASAKVEVTYGRRVLGVERLRTLAAAREKLRMALLRLAIRRPPIPFRRKKRRRR